MKTKVILTGIIICVLFNLNAHALTVGEMSVYSRLGDPLDSRIVLDKLNKNAMSTLKVSLASRELFIQEGIAYPENADDLQISVAISDDGQAIIHVRSLSAISEPFIELLLNIIWENGNIVREYALIIDPPKDLADQVLAQSDLSSQHLKFTESSQASSKLLRVVKEGETLGAILAQYLPEGITYQQALMAFYHLNPNAFEDHNVNNLLNGATLRIPDREQMLAMSKAKAVSEVQKLNKPLVNRASTSLERTPKLVIGGSILPPTIGKLPSTADLLPTEQEGSLQNFNQMASIVVELAQFEKSIKQEMLTYRELNKSIKDELLAVQDENREMSGRMKRMGKQLGDISQFLTLQALDESQGSSQLQQAESSLRPPWLLNESITDVTLIDKPSPIDNDALPQNTKKSAGSAAQLEFQTTAPLLSQIQQGSNQDSLQSGVPATMESSAQQQVKKEVIGGEGVEVKINESQSVHASTETLLVAGNDLDQSDKGNIPAKLVLKDKVVSLLSSMAKYSNNLGPEVWKVIAGITVGLLGLLIMLRLGGRRQHEPEVSSIGLLTSMEAKKSNNEDTSSSDNGSYKMKTEKYEYGSSLFDLSDESFMDSEVIDNESSICVSDESHQEDIVTPGETTILSANLSSEDEIYNMDPLAEAEVYLAYDRQKQAIMVLEEALEKNFLQPAVINKLLRLYQQNNKVNKFRKLFEISANQLQSDDEQQWLETKLLASKIIPEHPIIASHQESDDSIPLLTNSIPTPSRSQTQQSKEQRLASALKEDTDLSLDNDFDNHVEKQTSNKAVHSNISNSVEDSDKFESTLKEVNQHDPETALGLANAYIELGEDEIAKEFLADVIADGKGKIKKQAKKVLKSLAS